MSETAAPTRRDWFALATLSVGLGLIVLDGTIVGVALPPSLSTYTSISLMHSG